MTEQDAIETGPIEGHPPEPAPANGKTYPMGTDQEYSMAEQLREAREHVRFLEHKLDASIEENRHTLRCLDYLGRVAGGFEPDRVVEDMPAKDEDYQSVLVEAYEDRNVWHRVEFHRQGPIAIAAAQMRLVHAQLAKAQHDLAQTGDVVDAEIQDYVPDWAETVDIDNLAMVRANVEGVMTMQAGGRFSPSQAMVTAAWIYTMADRNLEDSEAGFNYLVERVQST